MNRITSQPVILPMHAVVLALDESPTIPFPRRGRGRSLRRRRVPRRPALRVHENDFDDPNSPLGKMRERLLKMIIANEWDRTHGHRAS